MQRWVGSLVLSFCALVGADINAAELNHPQEYARCMALAPSDPNDAFEMATAWKELGGGDAAEHCAAVALLHNGQAQYAARRLEILAQNIVAEPEFKGEILAQAGQAWLLHGDAPRAEAALTAAVYLLRSQPAVMIDRAQARAAMTDYQGAIDDLTIALTADPTRVEAYIFRASAYRYLDRLDEAQRDLADVLIRAPEAPEAFLERGIVHRLKGQDNAARDDWLRVLELSPDSEAAAFARTNIEKMDVKVD